MKRLLFAVAAVAGMAAWGLAAARGDGADVDWLAAGVVTQAASSPGRSVLGWHAFPDPAKFRVLGLPWFEENKPKLWRMPAHAMGSLPKGVVSRSKVPSGGRILLKCTTTRLALRAVAGAGGRLARFDTYVNGRLCRPAGEGKGGEGDEFLLFEGLDSQEKEIVIYLPHLQEVLVKAIGVDAQCRFSVPDRHYARRLPVVFYGSSVCQGSGTPGPGETYPAVLCRDLNLDFVNLGFGGAGKAERNVVELVKSIPACCYVFDLGKSYGMQDAAAFKAMLVAIRRSHPHTPIVAITPITSIKEVEQPSYSERSLHTRAVMRGAIHELIQGGEKQVFLVEGEDLIGFKDHAGLSKDGVHPSAQGYRIIATKLAPVLRKALEQ